MAVDFTRVAVLAWIGLVPIDWMPVGHCRSYRRTNHGEARGRVDDGVLIRMHRSAERRWKSNRFLRGGKRERADDPVHVERTYRCGERLLQLEQSVRFEDLLLIGEIVVVRWLSLFGFGR